MVTAQPLASSPMNPPKIVADWVEEVARLTRPDKIHWCDGSQGEYQALIRLMLSTGDLIELNQQTHPGCYLHRSKVGNQRAEPGVILHPQPGRRCHTSCHPDLDVVSRKQAPSDAGSCEAPRRYRV